MVVITKGNDTLIKSATFRCRLIELMTQCSLLFQRCRQLDVEFSDLTLSSVHRCTHRGVHGIGKVRGHATTFDYRRMTLEYL